MLEHIRIDEGRWLDDYASVAQLAAAVADLRAEAAVLAPVIDGRRVWMVNSTATGGGVAEMLPRMVELLRELHIDARWVVVGTERQEFFPLTKHLHNLIHGAGDPVVTEEQRALYETVSNELFEQFNEELLPGDLVVIHDPQPLGLGAKLAETGRVKTIWRCHIGLDEDLPQTRAAWKFLQPYLEKYDHAVFTAAEYIPRYLSGKVSIICPSLDPHSHKNRDLSVHKLVGILCDAKLVSNHGPLLTPPFDEPAMRLQPDGSFAPAIVPEDIGLLFRPIVTQVSRWDRLKGWRPLMEGFALLKRTLEQRKGRHEGREPRALDLARLVMAGPDPAAIQDDPEGKEVFEDIVRTYKELPSDLQSEIVVLSLPMGSRKDNALMVNALQRVSTIVVQNSLREGFGLTATEAMWKRITVLASSACGLRQQIRHRIDGHLVSNPEDASAVADALEELLTQPALREHYARSAQRRAHDDFLIFTQLRRWLRVLASVSENSGHSSWSAGPS